MPYSKAPSRRSVMAHQFSQVPQATIPRSSFNRSCGLKTTFDGGFLVPIFLDEALPGDTFNLRATLFARLATPIKPVMDNLFMESFFFFVPNRLVWDNWEKFNGAQDNPGDSTDFSIPVLSGTYNATAGSLHDYFGIPLGFNTGTADINALPFRCYNLIWNEWFRDQNLQDSEDVPTGNGPDNNTTVYRSGGLLSRGKRHDYFTSCLPWPQKGDPVTVPLGGYAPVVVDGQPATPSDTLIVDAPGETLGFAALNSSTPTVQTQNASGPTNTFADLAQATGVTINDLRQSFQIQKLLERDARGGTRYTEIIRSHFGVVSPDMRLQRPEFLGGGTSMVQINPVAQTTPEDQGGGGVETVQGNLAAFGTVQATGHGFTKSFTEHGYILGLINVRADLTYQQGLNRLWSRSGRYDFFWPALSHLGEQSVLSKEIFVDGSASDEDVFGYQERYAEYRYKPSQITGEFRSSAPASLDVWHLSQDFGTRPVLDDNFITDKPPIDRIIAVDTEPHFLLDAYFNLRCARPMPLYGVPGLIDHF